jgi:hypothetical protein
VVVFNWTKRPSDALRKRREGDAAQRLANTFPDRLLPDRPSLDGYTVREVSLDQVAQLFKSMGQPLDCPCCGKTLDVGLAQISVGLARWYKRYADEQSHDDRGRYKSEEEDARLHGQRLWVDEAPVPPWDWRKR